MRRVSLYTAMAVLLAATSAMAQPTKATKPRWATAVAVKALSKPRCTTRTRVTCTLPLVSNAKSDDE